MSRLASTGELSEPVYFFRLRRYDAPAAFEKVQDLVTGLVTTYQADKATPAREAAYAQFLDTKRAEAVQDAIDKINGKIQAL